MLKGNMYKLTIAVATYNRANYLKEQLDSILQQTYTDFYVIVYDNCSEDNTADVVKPYLSDQRFTYHRHDTVINNFNYALENCNTDYLLIVHDDDIMLPDMVKEEISILDSYDDVSIVWTNMNYISADGKTIINPSIISNYMDNKDCFINSREFIHILINKVNVIVCPTIMFRMSVIRTYNFRFRSDIGGGADCFLWLELNQINYKFFYIDRALYNYRRHESQDSGHSSFLISRLRKPVYFLLVEHLYQKSTLKKWLRYVDSIFWEELSNMDNKKDAFKNIKQSILFNDRKDFFFLLKIYYLLYEPSFFRFIKKYFNLTIKITKRILIIR